MERRGHHRRRGRATDVRLRTDGEVEERHLQQLAQAPQQHDVHGDPDQAEQEQPRAVQQRQQIHLHADAGDQEIQQQRTQARGARAFQGARTGETEAQAQRGRQHHHPHEWRIQAELCGPADVDLEPCGQRCTDGMRQADATEGHRHDQHQVGEAGNSLVLGLDARDALLQFIDGRGIGATARIDLRRAPGQEEQRRHPHVTDTDIDHGKLAEGGGVDVEHFAHRQHVGTAADPAAGQRSHAGPGIAGHGVGMDRAHHQEGHHGTEHDAGRSAQVHQHQLRAKPQDALDVHRQGQQDQRRRQQDVARDRVVEPGVLAVDQADGVVDAGNQVAQQQCRHEGVEALPQPLLARGGPEHGAEGGGDQTEDDDVVLDQGGRRHAGALGSAGRWPAIWQGWGAEWGCRPAARTTSKPSAAPQGGARGGYSPRCSVSPALTV
ncbi:hypothetical protein G6F68_009599 [Rhizopus microsporus]|nr:hypothetical protein G6F68_009599 [Rhizopus microsporus]